MARDFVAVGDNITNTALTAVDTGDWTIILWINVDGAGPASLGRAYNIDNGTSTGPMIRFNGSLSALQVFQGHATTAAQFTSNRTFNASSWYCVAGTFTSGTAACAMYVGGQQSPMTAETPSSSATGVGARRTSCTNLRIGNDLSSSTGWDGRIDRAAIVPWAMTLNEMERFRLGDVSVLFDHGAPHAFHPLTSPTLGQAEDLSGNGKTGTVTGCAVAEGPPVPFSWGEIGSA